MGSALLSRIDRLETSAGGLGRVFAVWSNGASVAEVGEFVDRLELRFDRRHDRILHLAMIDGQAVNCEVMSVMPWRK